MEKIYLQQAEMNDEKAAMNLIEGAREFLKEQGVDQWQNGYPDAQIIHEDILRQRGYFLTDGIVKSAYLCIDFAGDPSYEKLNGTWKSDLPYAVIHRTAVGSAHKGQGLTGTLFQLVEELCLQKKVYSLRVDTDENNKIMRHVLDKNGFEYCGTVWFVDSVKLAYEKVLKQEAAV